MRDLARYAKRHTALISVLLGIGLLAAGCGTNSAAKGKASTHRHYLAHSKHGHHLSMAAQNRLAQRVAVRRYASAILPALRIAAPVFDQVTASVSRGNSLDTVCGSFGDRIDISRSQMEGVPHQYSWNHPVGELHHRVMGVYHYMLGALTQCQTSIGGGDPSSADTSVSDMRTAANNMHDLVRDVTWMARYG